MPSAETYNVSTIYRLILDYLPPICSNILFTKLHIGPFSLDIEALFGITSIHEDSF